MNNYYYDLHIHSCLSPCCDSEMTPNNIVNMAMVGGLDIIALTDHNSVKNCPAAMKVAENKGITLIPGMELTTSEEIHVICLFPSLQSALDFGGYVENKLPNIQNNAEIFGEQLILNSDDEIIASEPKLLLNSTSISIVDVPSLVKKYSGVSFPAHIDKSSYSVFSVLGEFPLECNFTAAEITKKADIAKLREIHPVLQAIPLFINSDAHYLENIHTTNASIDIENASAQAVIAALSNGTLKTISSF